MDQSALTRQQLDELRGLLESRGRDLERQLEQADDSTGPVSLDQQSVGRVSRIDAIQQQQIALAGKKQATQMLLRIDRALRRLADGEYGDCLECGEPILFARLQVQPEADLCLACQSASESA